MLTARETRQRIANCHAANQRRATAGARRQITEAHKAIRTLRKFDGHPATRPGRHQKHWETLAKRIANPAASLAEIAVVLDVTKNVYASRLTRALAYAQRLESRHA